MKTARSRPRTRPGRGRARAAAIAVSVAVHGLALVLLVLSVPAMRLPTVRFAPDVIVYLQPLEPPLRPQSQSAAAPRAALAPAKTATLSPAASTPTARPAVAAPPPLSLPTPSPVPAATPAAAGQGVAAGAAPAGDGRDWRVRGDVHGLVHEAIGCSHVDYLKLTSAEQAACDRKYASLRGTELPHVDRIPAEKRAYYDSIAAAYAKVHAGGGGPGRMPVGPPAPALLADKGGGLYIPGVGCAVRFGIPRGWKPYHDRPPHSFKFGALPCFITPPQALGTEESAVQTPASLRERTDDAAHMKALDPPKP